MTSYSATKCVVLRYIYIYFRYIVVYKNAVSSHRTALTVVRIAVLSSLYNGAFTATKWYEFGVRIDVDSPTIHDFLDQPFGPYRETTRWKLSGCSLAKRSLYRSTRKLRMCRQPHAALHRATLGRRHRYRFTYCNYISSI